jgi:hypothetical protein
MKVSARPVPSGVPTAAGALFIGVAYGFGIRSWKLAAVVVAGGGLIVLDVVNARRR